MVQYVVTFGDNFDRRIRFNYEFNIPDHLLQLISFTLINDIRETIYANMGCMKILDITKIETFTGEEIPISPELENYMLNFILEVNQEYERNINNEGYEEFLGSDEIERLSTEYKNIFEGNKNKKENEDYKYYLKKGRK